MKSSPPPPDDIETLRTLVREAHECMKDLRLLIREAKETAEALEVAANIGVSARLDKAVNEGLAEYSEGIMRGIDEGTAAIFERFDKIFKTLFQGLQDEQPALEAFVKPKVKIDLKGSVTPDL